MSKLLTKMNKIFIEKIILMKNNGHLWGEDKVKGKHSKGSNFILLLPEAR